MLMLSAIALSGRGSVPFRTECGQTLVAIVACLGRQQVSGRSLARGGLGNVSAQYRRMASDVDPCGIRSGGNSEAFPLWSSV